MIEFRGAAGRIRAGLGKCLLLLSLGALAACASFSGMPEPFLPKEAVAVPSRYYVAEAIRRYHSPNVLDRENMTPRQWRDAVVVVYMSAADERYQQFRIGLSREMRGSNFGIEATTLALSSAATVSGQRTANILAAVVAALTGARASLSREVYFERTIPALAAGMEVARLEAATRILTNLNKPETEYPLEVAIRDAMAYGRAASIDQAIQLVTVEAANQAAQQRTNYEAAIENMSGIVAVAELPQLSRVTSRITTLLNEGKTAEIGFILAEFNISPTGKTLEQQAIAAIRAVRLRAEQGTLREFVDKMRTQHSLELDQ